MKLNRITLAAALVAAFTAPVLMAQTETTKPVSRDQVKAEAAAAHKAGAMEHGEASKEPSVGKTSLSREAVKAEAKAAHKAGAMEHGEASKPSKRTETGQSKTTREAVKAEAAVAHKDGTMPHGEAPQIPAK
jgi:hypothetical protein